MHIVHCDQSNTSPLSSSLSKQFHHASSLFISFSAAPHSVAPYHRRRFLHLSNTRAMTPPSLASLPPDLLAHVLNFATGSLRRDTSPPPATPLSTWRFSLVSQAFRSAYLSHLTSLSLSTQPALHLARLNWTPLSPCKSLRHLVITPDSSLVDADIIKLFHALKAWGIRIRYLDISVGKGITQGSVLCFASVFGDSILRLDVRVPWVRRVRRRRGSAYTDAVAPAEYADAEQVDPAELAAASAEGDALAQWLANQQNVANMENYLLPVVPAPENDQGAQVQMAPQEAQQFPWQVGGIAASLPGLPPSFEDGAHEPQQGALSEPNDFVQEMPAIPEGDALQLYNEPVFAEGEDNAVPAAAVNAAVEGVVALMSSGLQVLQKCNDVFATVVNRMSGLKELVIDGAHHINNTGVLALSKCVSLETLVMYSNHIVNDVAMKSVLSGMTNLKVLRLRDMLMIGNGTIDAVCTGPGKTCLEFLELTRIGRVTDPGIRKLVNSCDNLSTVHIVDCPRITCVTASHLSCSLKLRHVTFKPQPRYPLSNIAPVHLSCASSTLTSLQLIGCKHLSLDGIVALGNLPGLRKLSLSGLGHVSQDVMRSLGHFPRLDDLTLRGIMHLTDLGVKVLIGQRGHRFLHLSLLDSTYNLTDDALDCIITWCGSLRTLDIQGAFGNGFDKLCEAIPSASIRAQTPNGVRLREGHGGVWDPVQRET